MPVAQPETPRQEAAWPEAQRRDDLRTRIGRSRFLLWTAFVLTHLWLGYLNLNAPGQPLGDVVNIYKTWAENSRSTDTYVGIQYPWVYPIVALLPILAAGIFGFANYAVAWLVLVFVLDAVAFAALVGWQRKEASFAAGWWWIAFLLLLGPIAMGRIDSITIPVAIVALLVLSTRPRLAGALLTLATWIKVWPAAVIAAVLIASRERRRIATAVIATSLVIIVIALILGSGANVFSFIGQQTGRGLQVEAPVSTVWMWLSYVHAPGVFPYYDQPLNTFEIAAPGTQIAAALMNPILVVAVVVVAVLGIVAVRRGTPATELLAPLSLAFITAFIAFNKVGSPQYITWLAVPVILGTVTAASGNGPSFRVPAILVLVTAALTQGFYPYGYLQLLALSPIFLALLTLRNVMLFVVLGWAVAAVWRAYVRHPHRVAVNQPSRPRDDRGMLDDRFAEGE
jgi:hypothetical protein